VYKTPKSSIHYKKGRFAIDPDFHNDDNWEVDQKSSYIADKSVPKNSIHHDDEPDENRKNTQTMEQLGMPVAADGTINGGPKKMGKKKKSKTAPIMNQNFSFVAEKKKNEIKNYDQQVIPKSSIHYGQLDKVQGEPKMKFEKIVKAGFVPDEIKNLKTQGDWKSNLTKAVMDLTDDAQQTEPSIPVPTKPMSDTPDFPYANEQDGTMVYPIPGDDGSAIKGKDGWTFGNTTKIPIQQQSGQGEVGGCDFGQSINGEIDIPCTKKPLIKKLMMFMKKEQQNLQEGIKLKGIYEGKVVKLNTIFEGEHRRFKTFVKTNEGKIVKVHFGPGLNEECSGKKKINELKPETYDKVIGAYKGGAAGPIGGERGQNSIKQAQQLKQRELSKDVSGKKFTYQTKDGRKMNDTITNIVEDNMNEYQGKSQALFIVLSKESKNSSPYLSYDPHTEQLQFTVNSNTRDTISIDVATAKLLAAFMSSNQLRIDDKFKKIGSNYRNYPMF